MLTDKHIELFLAGLVTRVALAFPVAYIRSISLFHNEDKIADCTWEDAVNGTFRTYSVAQLPLGVQHIVVDAIDADGQPMHITSPVASL